MFVFRSTIRLAVLAAGRRSGAPGCGSSSPSAPTVAADVTISMVGDRGATSRARRIPQRCASVRPSRGRTTTRRRTTPRRTRRAFRTGTVSAGATSAAAHDERRRHVHVSLHDPPGHGGHARRAVTRLWQAVAVSWLDRCFPTGLAGFENERDGLPAALPHLRGHLACQLFLPFISTSTESGRPFTKSTRVRPSGV